MGIPRHGKETVAYLGELLPGPFVENPESLVLWPLGNLLRTGHSVCRRYGGVTPRKPFCNGCHERVHEEKFEHLQEQSRLTGPIGLGYGGGRECCKDDDVLAISMEQSTCSKTKTHSDNITDDRDQLPSRQPESEMQVSP
jgi:hypothetical protein